MGKLVRFWLPVLLYVALIFVVSSIQNLQPPQLFGPLSDKIPHACEYGILGFLLVRAMRGTNVVGASVRAGLVALILGMAVALSDELYQAHVPGRQSDPLDFLADTIGLLLSVFAFLVLRVSTRGQRRKRRASSARP
jgi:VanZ family protein